MHFGEHLTIDGYGGEEKLLNDKKLVLSCLNELPEQMDMKKLSKPEIYWAKGNDKKDPGGWSGFVVIEESHISIHTFPKKQFLSADVYTCKNGMDTEYVRAFFKDHFKLKDLETNFIKRGLKYSSKDI